MLATVLSEGVTTITNAAMEPEITDLAKFLNKMGAKIDGAGTNIIKITGVKSLKETGYKVMPDRIETGTFLCMAASTFGKIKICNTEPENITPVIHKLQECGCNIITTNREIQIDASHKKIKAVDIKTMPYPGFPTDMQSIFGATLTTAKGTSVIVENIFAWPGVGRVCVDAIFNRDFPVIQAYILLMAVLFVICNLLVDIFSVAIDPRMRKE